MRHQDISAGHFLELKPERRDAYALTDSVLYVLAVVPRPGYKVPWIKCRTGSVGEGMFRPEDFRRDLGTDSEVLAADLVRCETCSAPLDPLARFPGGLCISCFEKSEEAGRALTGGEILGMFGGSVRI